MTYSASRASLLSVDILYNCVVLRILLSPFVMHHYLFRFGYMFLPFFRWTWYPTMLCILFFISHRYLFWFVLTTRIVGLAHLWVILKLWFTFHSIVGLSIMLIVEIRMDLGGMFAWEETRLVVMDWFGNWRIYYLCWVLYLVLLLLSHVWHSCHCMGRGQISVKPTGHARFSVELFRLIWKLIN